MIVGTAHALEAAGCKIPVKSMGSMLYKCCECSYDVGACAHEEFEDGHDLDGRLQPPAGQREDDGVFSNEKGVHDDEGQHHGKVGKVHVPAQRVPGRFGGAVCCMLLVCPTPCFGTRNLAQCQPCHNHCAEQHGAGDRQHRHVDCGEHVVACHSKRVFGSLGDSKPDDACHTHQRCQDVASDDKLRGAA